MLLKDKVYRFARRHINVAPIVVGAAGVLFLIVSFGINTPYWDQWDMVKLLQQVHAHTFPFNEMWEQHNEHRVFFPLLVLLASALLTGWNTNAELVISFLFALISVGFIYSMTVSKFKRKSLSFVWCLLLSAWFFTPAQWENLLWGWQLTWFMSIAFTIATIFLLDKSSTPSKHTKQIFSGSIATAVIATFSLGSGMLIWIVGLGLLLLQKRKPKTLITWTTAGFISTLIYYYHYSQPSNSLPVTTFIHQPLNFVRYILAYIGRPVTDDLSTSLLIGGILLLLLVPLLYYVWQLKEFIPKFIPWLFLIVFSLLSCAITAISRVGFGYSQGMSSRYTTISTLYIIGITGLFLAIVDTRIKSKQSITPIVLGILAITVPMLFSSYTNGYRGLQLRSDLMTKIASCTANSNPSDECLAQTFPKPGEARLMLIYLKNNHLAGY